MVVTLAFELSVAPDGEVIPLAGLTLIISRVFEVARLDQFIAMAATSFPVSPILTVMTVPDGVDAMLCLDYIPTPPLLTSYNEISPVYWPFTVSLT